MIKTFRELGAEVLMPSREYEIKYRPSPPVNDFVWNESFTQEKAEKEFGGGILALSKEEILDAKPDVIFITAFENQEEIIKEIYNPLKQNSKLVAYSGNDYWDGAYDFDIIKNYLCADFTGYSLAKKYQVNHLYYRPFVNYDFFKYQGTSDSNLFGSYINEYQKLFPEEFNFCRNILASTGALSHKLCDSKPLDFVLKTLKESIATVHIKRIEGYGYSIIESMATGRPVFLHRQLAENKSYKNWAIEGLTAYYFSDIGEFQNKALAFYENREFRHSQQEACAKAIRKMINNEEQQEKLKSFLNNLI
jgi:glycosyltransferase involved in cell wall biosynthesis